MILPWTCKVVETFCNPATKPHVQQQPPIIEPYASGAPFGRVPHIDEWKWSTQRHCRSKNTTLPMTWVQPSGRMKTCTMHPIDDVIVYEGQREWGSIEKCKITVKWDPALQDAEGISKTHHPTSELMPRPTGKYQTDRSMLSWHNSGLNVLPKPPDSVCIFPTSKRAQP